MTNIEDGDGIKLHVRGAPNPVSGDVHPTQQEAGSKEQRGGVSQQHGIRNVHVGRHCRSCIRKCCTGMSQSFVTFPNTLAVPQIAYVVQE